MVVEEYTNIQVSKSNKSKLDNFKLINESYNAVLDELIKFGKENSFKETRIKNLTKKMEFEKNANIKIKKESVKASTQ